MGRKGKRDATSLEVMEYVIGDEHTFDLWVQWTAPNGKIKAVRPKLVAWIDMMGYLSIQKLGIQLPIYHGTSESVLAAGIGHLAGSSLPVGGIGTHCVLSGHRGLPSAKLLTDLDQMEIGDTFSVTVLHVQIADPAERSKALPAYSSASH